MDYLQQLKHPLWQKKRLEMLSAAEFECTQCGNKDATLHVHHKQYFKGRMAWEYAPEELDVLCESCHAEAHQVIDELKYLLSKIDQTEALALLTGYHFNSDWFDWRECDSGRDADPEAHVFGQFASLMRFLPPAKLVKLGKFMDELFSETTQGKQLIGGVTRRAGELS